MTSPDVIHGFAITQTAVNMMAIPGLVNMMSHTFRTPGTYFLVCNEYCGIGHQDMAGKIVVQ